MYPDVPVPVLVAWFGGTTTLLVATGHRLVLLRTGNRAPANTYFTGAVALAALFCLTRYPSPLRYYLDLWAPRAALYVNYSLVIWANLALLLVAASVWGLSHALPRLALGGAISTQIGTGLAWWALPPLEPPFSLSATARAGNGGAWAYLLLMVGYCGACAAYLGVLILRLAQTTKDPMTRRGLYTAAAGLATLCAAAVEEVFFLSSPILPMRVHGVLITTLVGGGLTMLALGTLLFSPGGQVLAARWQEWQNYRRLRPLGQRLAAAWPGLCLEAPPAYGWPTLFQVGQAGFRAQRIITEFLDLRRLLAAYLPDDALPYHADGAPPHPTEEAAYLRQGLLPATLRPRAVAADLRRLPPFPAAMTTADYVAFLQAVWTHLRPIAVTAASSPTPAVPALADH